MIPGNLHILRPAKPQKPSKKKIVGFDIETAGVNNDLILGCFMGGGVNESFLTVPEILAFINSRSMRGAIVVCTNLAFDLMGVLMNEQASMSRFRIAERKGRMYGATYYQNGDIRHPVHFMDSMNLLPASVKELGAIVGIPKMDHPPGIVEGQPAKAPTTPEEWQYLIDYCKNDALITQTFYRKMIIPFCEEHGISLKKTAASMALAVWRTEFLKDTFHVEDERTHDIVFAGYYGGRTECFKRGLARDVACYDFNSLYPSVMLYAFPDPNTGHYREFMTLWHIMNREGVCYVEGTQQPCYIPLLPIRHEGKLIFPVGKIKGYYTFVELRRAQLAGFTIEKIGEGVYYSQTLRPFAEFVGMMYKKRMEYKKRGSSVEVMYKLAMNSLYGKFSYNYRESSSIVHSEDISEKELKDAINVTPLAQGFTSISYESNDAPYYSFPIWSAYCTAYARLQLYEVISNPAIEPHVLYCDTDSVFLQNGQQLPTSDNLGALKLEKGYPVPKAIFVRPKFYMAHKPKIKGCPRLDVERFEAILQDKPFTTHHFTKLRTATRYNKPINAVHTIHKKLSLEDAKRQWSKPFNRAELQDSTPIQMTGESYE